MSLTEHLLFITDLNDEIVYDHCLVQQKEVKQQLLLFAYASLDIFKEIRQQKTQYFYYSIDKFMNYRVSLLLMPCGYKILFIHGYKNHDLVLILLKKIHALFLKVFFDFFNNECYKTLHKGVIDIYNSTRMS